MNVYLIRHGESLGNQTGKIQGRMDFPLSTFGELQARQLGEYLKELPLDYLYSSDLCRAFKTAQIVGKFQKLPVQRWDKISEVDLGPLQGLSRSEIYAAYPEAKSQSILTSGIAGTETTEALTKRCQTVVEQIKQHRHRSVALVTHGGFMSILLMYLIAGRHWVHCQRIFRIDNASITKVEWSEEEKPVIHYINQTIHLLNNKASGEHAG